MWGGEGKEREREFYRTNTIKCMYVFLLPQESSGGGRKKRSKKDPNAPKKPLSAYMLWLQENREAIKRKYPGSSVTDVSKKAGEMWKTVTAEEKSVSTECTVI